MNEIPPERNAWSQEGLTIKQSTSRLDDVRPDMWKRTSDATKKKPQQRWALEKPKIDNARQLRGIFFIEPNDEEFKLTMNATGRKLEVHASTNALQTTDEEQWRNPPQLGTEDNA